MKLADGVMEAIVQLMNSNIREHVHREIAPCTNEEFLKKYCEYDREFVIILGREFGIEV